MRIRPNLMNETIRKMEDLYADDGYLLVDIDDKQGEERLDSQYFRCNVEPSELYVMSVKGSSQHRIKTGETGFENLFITGDWIQNGFNAGFVEGAVVSGLLTAKAVSQNRKLKISHDNISTNGIDVDQDQHIEAESVAV